MYNIKTKFENCSYNSYYTIEGCATSQIEFTLEAKDFPTMQSKKNTQLELQTDIKEELANFKWLIYNDVNIEFAWYFSGYRKKESDKIGDLDNLIKPIIDAFTGENGLFVDDSQIGSLRSLWMSKDVSTSSDTVLRIFINFNNDDCCLKQNMRFVQLDKQMYALYHFDESDIMSLYYTLVLHHEQLRLRKRNNSILHKYPNNEFNLTQFNLFHRTRLKDIPNNKIYTMDKFKQLCSNAGLSYRKLLEIVRNSK